MKTVRTPTARGGESFTEAVAMLTRLPLSDAERAEDVRRLLAGEGTESGTEAGSVEKSRAVNDGRDGGKA